MTIKRYEHGGNFLKEKKKRKGESVENQRAKQLYENRGGIQRNIVLGDAMNEREEGSVDEQSSGKESRALNLP